MNEITPAAAMEPENASLAVTTQTDSGRVLDIIAQAARDPAVDPAKLHGLLDLQERILNKQAEALFNQALIRLTRKLPRIKKNGLVEYPKDKNRPDGPKEKAFAFATWEDIDRIIRPLLDEEGFVLSFDTAWRDGGGMVVTGTLLHDAGHSRSASIPLAVDTSGGKNNIQGAGSTFSYGKRYTATMLLNLVFEGEDDDGIRGGTVFLEDWQIEDIREGIDTIGAPLDAFLDQVMGAASIPAILKKDYAKAINALVNSKANQRVRWRPRHRDAHGNPAKPTQPAGEQT